VCFNFLGSAVQKFHFGGGFFWGLPHPLEDPKIWSKQLFHKCLPTLWVSTSCMLSSGGFAPSRTPKFGPNNCLTNIFLHYEFQLSLLNSSKVWFWGVCFPLPSWKTPKFGPNNCLTNNFLYCEFQLSMLSSTKVSFLGRLFWGVHPLLPVPPKMGFAPSEEP